MPRFLPSEYLQIVLSIVKVSHKPYLFQLRRHESLAIDQGQARACGTTALRLDC